MTLAASSWRHAEPDVMADALNPARFEQLIADVENCLPAGSAFAVLELMGAASRLLTTSPPAPVPGFIDAAIGRLAAILDVDLDEPPVPCVYDWQATGDLDGDEALEHVTLAEGA